MRVRLSRELWIAVLMGLVVLVPGGEVRAELRKGDQGVEAGRFTVGGKDTVKLKIWAPCQSGTNVRIELGTNRMTFVWTETAVAQGFLETGALELVGTEVVVQFPDSACRIPVAQLPKDRLAEFCVRRPPRLEVCCDLSFSAERGGANPSSQTFRIKNTGEETLRWSATKDAGWIGEVRPASGTLEKGQLVDVRVSVNISGLSEGNYLGSIRIESREAVNSPQVVTVRLEVRPAYPDLVIASFGARQPTRCEWDAELWADVKNVGSAGASGVLVAFYIGGSRYNASPVDLGPGQQKRVTAAWRMTGAGTFDLRAVADPDSRIAESNEGNNTASKTVTVTVSRECINDPCATKECGYNAAKCGTESVNCQPYCCRTGQQGQCLQWCQRCEERPKYCCWCVPGCAGYRDCPTLSNPTPLMAKAHRQPWSGWPWPLRESEMLNQYDRGGPLDKYDQYVLAARGYNPDARGWEEKAQGSRLLSLTFDVKRDGAEAKVVLGKHGSIIDDETRAAVELLRELFRGAVPRERIEEQRRHLEEMLFLGGLWWRSFTGDAPSLDDLLLNAWSIQSESWQDLGEADVSVGICHGLAAASAMEKEPTQPRTLYGIDFTVADLKGLLTKLWQEAEFISWSPTPRSLHVLLQEIIGEKGLALVMDLGSGDLRAHFPAYRYEIRKVSADGPWLTFEAEVWFAGWVGDAGSVGTRTFRVTFLYQLEFDDHWDIVSDGTWLGPARPNALWIPVAPRPGNPRLSLEIIREINADVVVTLSWDDEADLDLVVVGPDGEISRQNPSVGSGRLDRNVLGGHGSTESVFWPQGMAPAGEYHVLVKWEDGSSSTTGTVPFELKIVVGQEAWTAHGRLARGQIIGGVIFTLPVDPSALPEFGAPSAGLEVPTGAGANVQGGGHGAAVSAPGEPAGLSLGVD